MDIGKLHKYPWGLYAFDLLVESIIKTRVKLAQTKGYILDGFSYAFQIWIMEAIPDFGTLLGKRINNDITGPRCSKWTGAAKVSYEEIIQLESTFGSEGVIYPYISSTGNYDVFEAVEFLRDDEMNDARVDRINDLIRSGDDCSDVIWEIDESSETYIPHDEPEEAVADNEIVDDLTEEISGSYSRMGKKKLHDQGAEARKFKLLCKRSASKPIASDEDMKSFIEGMFQTSFSKLEEKLEMKIDDRLGKLENAFTQLKDSIVMAGLTRTQEEPSCSGNPSNVIPSRTKNMVTEVERVPADLYEVNLSQTSNINMEIGTQDYLGKSMGILSQDSFVFGFDPTQPIKKQESIQWLTPLTSFKGMKTNAHTGKKTPFTDMETWWRERDPKEDEDYALVHVSDDSWTQFNEWSMSFSSNKLQIGPSVFCHELVNRLIGRREWLGNEEIDAVMYLFRERTSLRQWKPDRVAFMNCLFSVQINNAYKRFLKDKKGFKWEDFLLQYCTGELPSHGRTNKVWDVDVDRMYVPVCVENNHWISLCISFVHRTIEVFDCSGKKTNRHVEPFAVLIPRMVKESKPHVNKKQLGIGQYSVHFVSMQRGINKSCCDCGVYALKFIECHLLGLSMSLMNDDNIREARIKIVVDLWQAANDPVLINRMSKYECAQSDSKVVNID